MQLRFAFPKGLNNSFTDFVADEKNSAAVAFCRSFVQKKPEGRASLVLHGLAGTGKTHLLFAMSELLESNNAENQTLYLDCKELADKVMKSETYEELKTFLNKYDKAVFLAVDHLEMIEEVESAQEQVFHLYNAVINSGGRFVGAVKIPPNSWKFADYLKTRLLWGQVVEVNRVDDDNTPLVLNKVAKDLGLHLPLNASQWLTSRLDRNPATLIEALRRIDRYSLTVGRKVSIQLIKKALEG